MFSRSQVFESEESTRSRCKKERLGVPELAKSGRSKAGRCHVKMVIGCPAFRDQTEKKNHSADPSRSMGGRGLERRRGRLSSERRRRQGSISVKKRSYTIMTAIETSGENIVGKGLHQCSATAAPPDRDNGRKTQGPLSHPETKGKAGEQLERNARRGGEPPVNALRRKSGRRKKERTCAGRGRRSSTKKAQGLRSARLPSGVIQPVGTNLYRGGGKRGRDTG